MSEDAPKREAPGDQEAPESPEASEKDADETPPRRGMSRRDLLRTAGAAGAAALLPGRLSADDDGGESGSSGPLKEGADRASPSSPQTASSTRMVSLSVRESALLAAMVDRLIPSDEHGPGALESGALRYIDRVLAGDLEEREDYRTGLAGLDRYSHYSRGAGFLSLEPRVQDSVLLDLQTGGATGSGAGFGGSSGSFFNMVKGHVWDAMFGDPHYGGNQGFAGWDLINYPGVRQGVSPETQRQLEEGTLEPMRRSAYDFPQFG